MTTFALAEKTSCAPLRVPIDKHSFEEAKRSFNLISEVILLEERFDSVACNFLDFEKEMIAKLLDFTYAGFKDGIHQMSVRRHLNRLLMNTLSAARSFVDHLPHTCNLTFGKDDERNSMCVGLLRMGYDEMLGYRICEALRNHSQHSGFPIQSIKYSTQMEWEMPHKTSRHSISPIVDTEALRRNKRFKQPVLIEMEALGLTVDLKQHLREYMSGLARAHYKFRELAEPIVTAADEALNNLLDHYTREVHEPESKFALHAVSLNERDKWIDSVPLATGMFDYWEYLAKNNVHFCRPGNSFLATAEGFLQRV